MMLRLTNRTVSRERGMGDVQFVSIFGCKVGLDAGRICDRNESWTSQFHRGEL
jgi:hypothetical protein